MLGLLLAECAGRLSQRSKAIWFESHWEWIVKLWEKYGGSPISRGATPSQSTISRMLTLFSEETFSRLVYKDERLQLWEEWDSYTRSDDEIAKKKTKVQNPYPSFASTVKQEQVAQAKTQVEARLT